MVSPDIGKNASSLRIIIAETAYNGKMLSLLFLIIFDFLCDCADGISEKKKLLPIKGRSKSSNPYDKSNMIAGAPPQVMEGT